MSNSAMCSFFLILVENVCSTDNWTKWSGYLVIIIIFKRCDTTK